MTSVAGRIALVLFAALLGHAIRPSASGALSDMILALAAGFIAWRFMRGYELEKASKTEPDPGKQANTLESARILYALNSLHSPILICAAWFGCALKIFAVIGSIPAISHLLWPAGI